MGNRRFLEGHFYHIFNKCLDTYNIFQCKQDSLRFFNSLAYYNTQFVTQSFSKFLKDNIYLNFEKLLYQEDNSPLKYISYCIMPNHYHFLIKVLDNNHISKYISDVENSYTKFFNKKYERKGPLWQSRFKAVHIRTNEQLLHVSRYIHLNPTTAGLVQKPEDWKNSSYRNFIYKPNFLNEIITEISINDPQQYRRFVTDQINYQKQLKRMKKMIID